MEELADESCSVVYFCASASGDICELHDRSALEKTEVSEDSRQENAALDIIRGNVRTLLDEDQGGFDEGEAPQYAVMLHVHATDCGSLCELASGRVPRAARGLC